MKQVSRLYLRHILSQSRSDVTYCPDVIEARFTKVCDVRSECEHRVTPSVLTVSESGTAVPARSMLENKGKVRRRCHEPNKIASDLSGIMAKPLKQNHAYMDEIHSSSFSLPD